MKPRWLKRKRFRQLTPADPLLIAGGGDVVAQHRLVRFSNGSRMAASGARSATERASEFWGQGDDPWRRWFVQVCDKLVLSVAGALMLIVDRLIALLALPMMLLGRLRRLILLALPTSAPRASWTGSSSFVSKLIQMRFSDRCRRQNSDR